jgi:hypothetical protein
MAKKSRRRIKLAKALKKMEMVLRNTRKVERIHLGQEWK